MKVNFHLSFSRYTSSVMFDIFFKSIFKIKEMRFDNKNYYNKNNVEYP